MLTLYDIILYCILYYIILYNIILYNIILYYNILPPKWSMVRTYLINPEHGFCKAWVLFKDIIDVSLSHRQTETKEIIFCSEFFAQVSGSQD